MYKIVSSPRFFIPLILFGLVIYSLIYQTNSNARSIVAKPAPEFTQISPDAWLGSKPLKIGDLRGKVVLVDFWTFGCWNCYRSFPWLNALEAKLHDQDFQIIGIHTPEFDREKVKRNIAEKIAEFGLKHPTMMDNDFAYWKRMKNRYWPTYYLIDKRGFIRHVFIGETHADTPKAIDIEVRINELLNEVS